MCRRWVGRAPGRVRLWAQVGVERGVERKLCYPVLEVAPPPLARVSWCGGVVWLVVLVAVPLAVGRGRGVCRVGAVGLALEGRRTEPRMHIYQGDRESRHRKHRCILCAERENGPRRWRSRCRAGWEEDAECVCGSLRLVYPPPRESSRTAFTRPATGFSITLCNECRLIVPLRPVGSSLAA